MGPPQGQKSKGGGKKDGKQDSRVRNLSAQFERMKDSHNEIRSSQPQTESTGAIGRHIQASDDHAANDETWTCKVCAKEFSHPDDEILECELCHDHKCASCVGLTSDQYKTMARDDVFWYCSDICKNSQLKWNTLRNLSIMPKIDAIESSVKCIEGKLDQLKVQDKETEAPLFEAAVQRLEIKLDQVKPSDEDGIEWPLPGATVEASKNEEKRGDETDDSWAKVTGKKRVPIIKCIKDAISESAKENKLKDDNARNFVVFRASEPNGNSRKKKIEADETFVKELCEEIDAGEIVIEEVRRLGKEEEGKTRPLLVRTKDVDQKSSVMRKLPNLANASSRFSSVSICHDLTSEQREERRKMVDEAKAKTAEEGSSGYEYRVRNTLGPHWDAKIVKLKVKQNKAETAAASQTQEAALEVQINKRVEEIVQKRLQEIHQGSGSNNAPEIPT